LNVEKYHEHNSEGEDRGLAHLDDKQKGERGIGGMLGTAALLGGGVWAYSHYKNKKEEEAKQQEWAKHSNQANYDQHFQQRIQIVEAGNHGQAVYWVPTQGGNIPPNAIQAGNEQDGTPLYVARAFLEGGVHPGKAGRHLNLWKGGAAISYGGREIAVDKYEVLAGDPSKIRWIPADGMLRVQGWQPIEGGREANGKFLFIISAEIEGGWHPGKIQDGDDHANVAYGGSEMWVKQYRVAAYV